MDPELILAHIYKFTYEALSRKTLSVNTVKLNSECLMRSEMELFSTEPY